VGKQAIIQSWFSGGPAISSHPPRFTAVEGVDGSFQTLPCLYEVNQRLNWKKKSQILTKYR
jgi:hypothetical protein